MSGTPPPFGAQQPAKKNNTVLIVVIVLVVLAIPCLLLVGGGFWVYNVAKTNVMPMAGCAIGFEELRDSILAYADDNDGKLPNAATWQDDVRSYFAKESKGNKQDKGPFETFQPDGDWGCKHEGGMTGIAFNSELSGKKVADIKDPEDTIVIYEVPAAKRNASGVYKEQAKSSSPKIFGERRGWFKIALKGDGDLDGTRQGRRIKFEAGTNSDSNEASSSGANTEAKTTG